MERFFPQSSDSAALPAFSHNPVFDFTKAFRIRRSPFCRCGKAHDIHNYFLSRNNFREIKLYTITTPVATTAPTDTMSESEIYSLSRALWA